MPLIDLRSRFRQFYWLAIPILAIAAYLPILRIGFLSDDFVLLNQAAANGLDLGAFVHSPLHTFYRPVGHLLTWEIGWQLWGFNPMPYHLIGLLVHAGVALALTLWLTEVTRRPLLGFVAGALFAVFPLHMEAVGWIADQWDLWAAFFTVLGLWLFTKWWREPPGRRGYWYWGSVLLYALGLFSKESVLALLPLFGLSALLAASHVDSKTWKRLGFAMLPLSITLALYFSLRFFLYGRFGGYDVPEGSFLLSYGTYVWDIVVNRFMLVFFAPINTEILPQAFRQWTALIIGLSVFFGLIMYGREARRWLLLALAWLVFSIAPIFSLSLGFNPFDLSANRFLYLASAGYCIGVATLIQYAFTSARTRTRVATGAVLSMTGLLLSAYIVLCWVNLRPWQTASAVVLEVNQQLRNLIPVQPRPLGTIWYVQDIPDSYQGAYMFRLGLGPMQYFTRGPEQAVWTETVSADQNIEDVFRPEDTRDSYAMRFKLDENTQRYNVSYLSGVTSDTTPPIPDNASVDLRVWDFRTCSRVIEKDWQVMGAESRCVDNEGLTLQPTVQDPYLLGPKGLLDLREHEAWYMRIRVSARYNEDETTESLGEAGNKPQKLQNGWAWKLAGEGLDWSNQRVRKLPIPADGKAHAYSTYLTLEDFSQPVAQLRFNLINTLSEAHVEWIAIDFVR